MREKKGYEYCSGCGVCLLSCPVWHGTRTMSLTRKARAKAMQGGATPSEIAFSIDSCLLCGACEIACPEGIGLADLNISQRRALNSSRTTYPHWYPDAGNLGEESSSLGRNSVGSAAALLLAGEMLGSDRTILEKVMTHPGLSGKTVLAPDDGRDLARAIEAGFSCPKERIDRFSSALGAARTLIVAEGMLHRPLRKWLGSKKVMGLGEALLSSGNLRAELGPADLYVIESRGYHSDHGRLVLFYDRLRNETGCQTNLDLQRTAVTTGASSLQGRRDIEEAGCVDAAKRILSGRKISRIVVEDLADLEPFRRAADIPVVHLAVIGNKV